MQIRFRTPFTVSSAGHTLFSHGWRSLKPVRLTAYDKRYGIVVAEAVHELDLLVFRPNHVYNQAEYEALLRAYEGNTPR